LAQLSGVSVTWYTWLEQARDITVSRQVIDSLARVLRLAPTERAYLFNLAGLAIPTAGAARPDVDDTLRRLVETLSPNPAYVVNPWWDILTCNEAYDALLGGLEHRPAAERNSLWLTFAEGSVRQLLVDWATEASQLVGQLRANVAKYPGDPRGPELVEALLAASPAFREFWSEHEVRRFQAARKRFRHPEAGRLDLDYLKLTAADDDRQQLIVFLPADQATATKLVTLIPV
jgi:transcriptional regulator with XRE-family HTH domain